MKEFLWSQRNEIQMYATSVLPQILKEYTIYCIRLGWIGLKNEVIVTVRLTGVFFAIYETRQVSLYKR